MDALRKIDQVAYVRFASVYREFEDITDFAEELKQMLSTGPRKAARKKKKRGTRRT